MSLLEAAKALLDARDPLEHERGWKALAAAIASAESAPAVVTAEELAHHLHDHGWTPSVILESVAALVVERTAAAVEAARAEERERAASVCQEHAHRHEGLAMRAHQEGLEQVKLEAARDAGEWRHAEATIRGQSEAPAPAARPGGGWSGVLCGTCPHEPHVGVCGVPLCEDGRCVCGGGDELDEGWLCRTIADETGCKDDERVLDAARAIATRLRAREVELASRHSNLAVLMSEREAAARARVQALVEAAEGARKRCALCHGTGEWWPHCYRCDDSTDDHDDCPEKRPCTECAALRAALDALGKET